MSRRNRLTLWERLFPPSLRFMPWPIPWETGWRWSQARYARRTGYGPSFRTRIRRTGDDLLFFVATVLFCAAIVVILTAVLRMAQAVGW